MSNVIEVILDFMTQFAGGRGGIDHNVVQFGLAALFWGTALIYAIDRRREDNPPRERMLIPGFSLGLAREFLMFGLAFILALGLIDLELLHVVFPPLEHALSNGSIFFVAGAFLLFLLKQPHLVQRYLILSQSINLLCYLATFWWWGDYILANPTSKFGQTWCDVAFHTVGSFWTTAAFVLILQRGKKGWLRNTAALAMALFFLFLFLKIPDIALDEIYEAQFTPIRHVAYLLGVFLLVVIYLREQAIERKQNKARILELAYFDAVTGLPNRYLMQDRLRQSLVQAERFGGINLSRDSLCV